MGVTLQENEVALRCRHSFTVWPKNYESRVTGNQSTWMAVKYEDADTKKKFSATGIDLPTVKNVVIILRGTWVNDKRYGRSLNVIAAEIERPNTKAGVISYLATLKVGIGRVKAESLYDTYGEKLWDILQNDPDALTSVKGISKSSVAKLGEKMESAEMVKQLLNLFNGAIELTASRIKAIRKKFNTAEDILQNPYVLCEIEGFNFRQVDPVGLQYIAPDDARRILPGIDMVLQEASTRGHSCLPKKEFLHELNKLLPGVAGPKITDVCNEAWRRERIKISGGMVYSAARYDQEVIVAENLARLLKHGEHPVSDIDGIIEDYEKECGITLADCQKDAVRNAFIHQVNIITGGPGVGKTTVTKAILYAHKKVYGKSSNPILMSPTGHAARRMTEATGYPAQTIHSAVGYRGENAALTESDKLPIQANLFVVDECSMMDMYIAGRLLMKVPSNAKVIFVGDPDQLPSVGCGNVLFDMIQSGMVPTTRLNVIFRQATESPIVTNAAKIHSGDPELAYSNKFCIFREKSTENVFNRAASLYRKSVAAYGLDNVFLLCPYREKTGLCVNAFNQRLQAEINPPVAGELEMQRDRKVTFRPRDRVMQMRNTEDAQNGDIGYIKRIEQSVDLDDPSRYVRKLVVEFNGDGVEHTYGPEEVRDLDLAYCTTIHKSQGSEAQTVIMTMSLQHEPMLRRNLIYTGITRAKQNVAIITENLGAALSDGRIADKSAVEICVNNDKTDVRYTLLSRRIVNLLNT